jgi:phosphatidylethanolamine-binding protein (PEBP) family uncharacterized protein
MIVGVNMRFALGCLLAVTVPHTSTNMSASFEWGPTKKCFDTRSPPFSVSGVPAGTAKLDVRMQDKNATSYPHGGGKVAYTGKNAISCPPAPATHNYRFTVNALDPKGKTLATTQLEESFHQ